MAPDSEITPEGQEMDHAHWLSQLSNDDLTIILGNRPDLKERLMRILDMPGTFTAPADATTLVLSEHPLSSPEVVKLKAVLSRIKLRLHFMGWPAEAHWNAAEPGKNPRWIPDWRYEICLLENSLHGSPIDKPEKPTDTIPAYRVTPHVPDEGIVQVPILYFKPEGKYYSTGHIEWDVAIAPQDLRAYLKALQDRGENLPGMNSHCRHFNVVIQHPAFPIMISATE